MYPFEIHITVTPNSIDNFIEQCNEIKVKPIVLDLQSISGLSVLKDVMTSSKHEFIDEESAYKKALEIANHFENVKRIKIETVPWYPNKTKENYFESHIQVIVNDSNISFLRNIAKEHKIHISKNIFKKTDNDNYIIMLTIRNYDCNEHIFRNEIQKIISILVNKDFEYKKVEVEYCVYDSNHTHDKDWLNAN